MFKKIVLIVMAMLLISGSTFAKADLCDQTIRSMIEAEKVSSQEVNLSPKKGYNMYIFEGQLDNLVDRNVHVIKTHKIKKINAKESRGYFIATTTDGDEIRIPERYSNDISEPRFFWGNTFEDKKSYDDINSLSCVRRLGKDPTFGE